VIQLALSESARLDGDDETFVVRGTVRDVSVRASPAVVAALRRLSGSGAPEQELLATVMATEGSPGAARLGFYLHGLGRHGLLQRSAWCEGRRLATLLPGSHESTFVARTVGSGRFVLSRFAYFHVADGDAILESPRASGRLRLEDPRAVAFVHALSRPRRLLELCAGDAGLTHTAAAALLGLLAGGGFAVDVDDDCATVEETDPALRSWEFHDLLFHARSRHAADAGATFRFLGEFPQPGPRPPARAGLSIDLARPDPDALRRTDPPFAVVQEARRSRREYGPERLTVRELGEFLHRTNGVTGEAHREEPTQRGPVKVEIAHRPFPGAGALYELELYVVAASCEGLEPGIYHHDARGHRLVRLAAEREHVAALLAGAAAGAMMAGDRLQVLIIIAARVPRLAWKYSGIAYAAVLKDTGALIEVMYLVATAMGLSPCALGSGDSERFAMATGLPCVEETSVGEFLLGGAPA
jgi:SagB-type dehydrogenase family enzyme